MGKGAFILLLLALGAGIAIGFVGANVSGGGGGYTSSSKDDGDAGSAPAPEPEMEPLPPPPLEGYASLADAIDDIPIPAGPRGNGVITGQVLDETGRPMTGILVRATPKSERTPRNYRQGQVPEDRPIEELVQEHVTRIMGDRKTRRDAYTNSDGRYELKGIGEKKYYVVAYGQGYQFQPTGGRGYDAEAGGEVDFTAKPVWDVEISVLAADGSPAKSARIERQMYGRWQHAWTWSSANTRMPLEPGTHLIRAADPEGSGAVSEEVRCEVGRGKTSEKIVLKLEDRPGIRGVVRFPEDETEGNARIYALLIDGEEPTDKELLGSRLRSYAYSRNGGKFTFSDLPPGRYAVGVAKDREILERESVDVASGPVDLDLEIPVPDASECVIVRVEGPDGPITGRVQINAGVSVGGNSRSGSGQVSKLRDGSYRILNPELPNSDSNDLPVYTLSVSTQTYGAKTVEYDPVSQPAVTVTFDAPGTLDVQVIGYEGSEYVGKISLSVSMKQESRDNRWGRMGFSGGSSGLGRDGTQTFGPLAPGEYEIALSIQSERRRTFSAGRTAVTIRSGENRQTVEIPKLFSLTVIVPDGDDDTGISLRSASGSSNYYRNSAKLNGGEARFENVPAGAYEIRGRTKTGSGSMEVQVPGQAVVRFAPVAKNAMLVSITSTDGGYAKAGFRDGDLVIGINGVEFQNEQHMGGLYQAAWASDGVKFEVLRGGRRLTISADPSSLRGNSGGRMRPASR